MIGSFPYRNVGVHNIWIFKKVLNLTLFAYKNEADEERKIFAAKIFTKDTCTWNYSRFYVKGQQELCPFYMSIPYGNAFCADSSQALQVKNFFVATILCKFQVFPCSIHVEIPKKSVIWTMWEGE